MAAEQLFIDSGGFYALISAESETHEKAVAIMEECRRNRRRAATTDYVLDEIRDVAPRERFDKTGEGISAAHGNIAGFEYRMDDTGAFCGGTKIYVETFGSKFLVHGLREFCRDEGTPARGRAGGG
jgi:hypothetical protein